MTIFRNLKYRQVRVCVDVLNETKAKKLEVIKRRHSTVSENFDGVNQFLKDLGFLREENENLSMSRDLERSGNRQWSDNELKGLLRNALLNPRGPLSNVVQSYFDNFKIAGNEYVYEPLTESRVKESGIRNFFIELDFVERNPGSGSYKIKDNHRDLFEAYLRGKALTPRNFALILKNKDKLGKDAESEVLRYERERLAGHPDLLARIEYTASKDVAAGYDILSWETGHRKDRPVPRYIEVKAVSMTDSSFYWSRNEIEKARQLRTQYFLYLLPVIDGKSFDTSNLEIIPDPTIQILNNRKNWNRQVETYLFSKTYKE